ncbi:MAG: efflux RND transporter permease subunit [Comamonadaceae bacterium]|nr:efflux RND transporter permease subunit [Comamonadaceae bacterium]
MLIYLEHALARRRAARRAAARRAPICATRSSRARCCACGPKAMTVAAIIAGLLPIMCGTGTGSEVMQRIAAPMVGGMVTAPLLSMFLMPVAYFLLRRRGLRIDGGTSA